MSRPAIQFQKAIREQAKLKILVTGASGSGKTYGALTLADDLAPGKIAVIDSEKGRSSYYADQVAFDVLLLDEPKPDDYLTALHTAVEAGYTVVIIDSLSHAWQNVLDRKEAYDRANPRSNSYTNWKLFSAEWDRFIRGILEVPVHVIATARSKQAYEQTEVEGKKKVLKVGLQPVLREGTEYEFALHFDLTESHKATVQKDNTNRFGDLRTLWDLCDGSIARELKIWLAGGMAPVPRPIIPPSQDDGTADGPVELPLEHPDLRATEKQTKLFQQLMQSSVWSEKERAAAERTMATASRKKAGDLIDRAKGEIDRRQALRLQAPPGHPDAWPVDTASANTGETAQDPAVAPATATEAATEAELPL